MKIEPGLLLTIGTVLVALTAFFVHMDAKFTSLDMEFSRMYANVETISADNASLRERVRALE